MKSPNVNLHLEDAYGVGSSSKDHHVVRIEVGDVAGAAEALGCCVACREPLEWFSVGLCGHRAVCPKCMVRIRYVDGDKNCCVCRAHCPTVLVTRADAARRAATTAGSVFREYWYHAKTAAYFDNEQQYQAAREACKKKLSPYYHPLHVFVTIFGASIIIGAVIGSGFAEETKHMSLKVLAYALSISVALSVVGFIWFSFKCNRDPLEDNDQESRRNSRLLE